MSEEIKYCNICNYLGLDFKTGSFYCSLSHRKDNLPDVLSCKDFKTSDYIQRLKQKNERLQMLSCANCGEKYLSPDGAELYDKNVQLQKENEELKSRLKTLDDEILTIEITPDEFERHEKYKQALEEIKNYCYERSLDYDYTAYCVVNKIDEVFKNET